MREKKRNGNESIQHPYLCADYKNRQIKSNSETGKRCGNRSKNKANTRNNRVDGSDPIH